MHISDPSAKVFAIDTDWTSEDRAHYRAKLLEAMEVFDSESLSPREEEMLRRLDSWLAWIKDSELLDGRTPVAFTYVNTCNDDNSLVFVAWRGYDEYVIKHLI